jgi:sugar O-acyltransferase (sialic acid O-acetyltransferase NeuD family)
MFHHICLTHESNDYFVTLTIIMSRANQARREAKRQVKSVVIIGAGGSGREVLEILKDRNKVSGAWDILGFIDEAPELKGKIINRYPVLGGLYWLEKQVKKPGCICSVNNCEARKKLVARMGKLGAEFVNVIHPAAHIGDSVILGSDIVIYAGSLLTANITIGDHVHINFSCGIGHDVVIGPYCTISGLVNINGNARLGEGVFIGSGATVIPDVSIGDWTTIGAGAVVVDDVPGGVTAVGVPARPIEKSLSLENG